jgi:hypothetical protein
MRQLLLLTTVDDGLAALNDSLTSARTGMPACCRASYALESIPPQRCQRRQPANFLLGHPLTRGVAPTLAPCEHLLLAHAEYLRQRVTCHARLLVNDVHLQQTAAELGMLQMQAAHLPLCDSPVSSNSQAFQRRSD